MEISQAKITITLFFTPNKRERSKEEVERDVSNYINRIKKFRKKNHLEAFSRKSLKIFLERSFLSEDENKTITLTYKSY